MRLREGRPLSPAGGNFLYVRHTAGRVELIFAGEAQNLLKDCRERWSEAAARFQVSDLFTRLNLSERIRKLEHDDILGANLPPMNAGLAPAAPGAALRVVVARGEEAVELAAGRALGEAVEHPVVRDPPGRAQELAPGGGGEPAPEADPPRP